MDLKQFAILRESVYKREHFTYLNLSIYNPETNTQKLEAKFDTNVNIPVLQDPEAYVAAVTSFNVPSSNISLFTFVNNAYTITLSHMGNDFAQNLIYIPYSNDEILNKNVIFAQQFLDSINNAFALAYAALIIMFPAVVNAAPYMIYDNGKFTLVCDGLNYNVDLVDPVEIFFNSTLYNYFSSMQAYRFSLNASNDKDVLILVKNNGAGSSTGYLVGNIFYISTEYDTISSWGDIKSIAVLSSTTGIKNHILITNTDINGNIGNNLYEPIIASTDIVIKESDRHTYIDYTPKVLQYNDITSKNPLIHIDFRFVYLTRKLNVRPILLNPGESCNIIIQYRHKSILS